MLETEYLVIEELPVGCVIHDKIKNCSIVIGSEKDAKAVIESLERLIDCWYSEDGE